MMQMLLSLGTQMKLKYAGYLAGEKTCKTGEKVLRKAAELCDKGADKCAEGAAACKKRKMTLKDLLDLYKDPDNREEIQRMLAAKRSKGDDSDDDDTIEVNVAPERVIDNEELLVFEEQPAI